MTRHVMSPLVLSVGLQSPEWSAQKERQDRTVRWWRFGWTFLPDCHYAWGYCVAGGKEGRLQLLTPKSSRSQSAMEQCGASFQGQTEVNMSSLHAASLSDWPQVH